MDNDDLKLLTQSKILTIGMRYIQKAIKEDIDDPAKVELDQQTFFTLCQTALIDPTSASSVPEERPLVLMKELNKERMDVIRVTTDLENLNPNNGNLRNLRAMSNELLCNIKALYQCYKDKRPPPLFDLTPISILIPEVDHNISPDCCNIKVSSFTVPKNKEFQKSTFTVTLKHNLIQEYTSDITPNQSVTTSITGFADKKDRIFKALVVTLTQIQPKLLGKESRTVIGESRVAFNDLANTNHIRKEVSLTKEKCDPITFVVDVSTRFALDQTNPKKIKHSFFIHRVSDKKPAMVDLHKNSNIPPEVREIIKYLFILPQEELDQFIDTETIDQLVLSYNNAMKALTAKNLEMPPEYTEQINILKAKKEKILKDIEDGQLTMDQFKAIEEKQLKRNQEVQQSGRYAGTPLENYILFTIQKLKEQIESFD